MKRNYEKNILAQRISAEDILTIINELNPNTISRKHITSLISKIKNEPNDNKLKNVIRRMTQLWKAFPEFILKTDLEDVKSILFEYRINDTTFESIKNFVNLFKNIEYKKFTNEQKEFMACNFYNYYIFKNVTNNFVFDICVEESCINGYSQKLFYDLYKRIAIENLKSENLKIYISSLKNPATKVNLSAIFENKYPINLANDTEIIKIVDPTGNKNIKITDYAYIFCCYINMENNKCVICDQNIVNIDYFLRSNESVLYKNLKQKIENALLCDKIDDILFFAEHTNEGRSKVAFERIIKLIFTNSTQNFKLFSTLRLFNLTSFVECENIISDLFSYIIENHNEEQSKICISIINQIDMTPKIFYIAFILLYKTYIATKNQFLRTQIKYTIHKHEEFMKKHKREIILYCVSLIKSNVNCINSIFCELSEILDMETDEFIERNLFYIAPILHSKNLFHLIDKEHENISLLFIIVNHIENNKEVEMIEPFDLDLRKIQNKFGVQLVALLLLRGFTIESINKTEILNNNFIVENMTVILFYIKNYCIENNFTVKSCIFTILLSFINGINPKHTFIISQIFPFLEYFYGIKDNENSTCKNNGHDSKNCKVSCLQRFIEKSKIYCTETQCQYLLPYIELNTIDYTQTSKNFFKSCNIIANMRNKMMNDDVITNLEIMFSKFFYNKYLLLNENSKTEGNEKIDNENMGCAVFGNNLHYDEYIYRYYQISQDEKLKKYLNRFIKTFYMNFRDCSSALLFLGRMAPLHAEELLITYNKKYIAFKKFDIEEIAIFALENYLIDFDSEKQDIYLYVIQETLKFVPDKSKIKASVFSVIKQFESTKYHLEHEFLFFDEPIYSKKVTYRNFLENLINHGLQILREKNFIEYFNLLKFSSLFSCKIMEFYLLCITKALFSEGVNLFEPLLEKICVENFSEIDNRILKFIKKANIFCEFKLISDSFNIELGLNLKDYHYLLRIAENIYRANDEILNTMQFVYYKLNDHDNCRGINKSKNLLSGINIFFELCCEKDFGAANNCLKNISDISKQEYELLNDTCINNSEEKCLDYEEIFSESYDIKKFLEKWDYTENNHNYSLHLLYDINLLKNTSNLDRSLQTVQLRRKIKGNQINLLNEHISIFYVLENQLKEDRLFYENRKSFDRLKLRLKEFKECALLEKVKILRIQKNYNQCKEEISKMLIDGIWAAFYEDTKLKLLRNQKNEARDSLSKLLNCITNKSKLYEKAIIMNVQLNETAENFVSALEEIKTSEKLYFLRGKFYEKHDPYLALESYQCSLNHGTKFINESLPKIIHLLCERNEEIPKLKKQKNSQAENIILATDLMKKFIARTNSKLFLPFFNQILSKINHTNANVYEVISKFLTVFLINFTQKSAWNSLIALNSSNKITTQRMKEIVLSLPLDNRVVLQNIIELSKSINAICARNPKKESQLSLTRDFQIDLKYDKNVVIPNSKFKTKIAGFMDEVHVFASLQSPKRITVKGENGKVYYLLCKPNDDLRKDARFIDLNHTLNYIFKKDEECRKRNLYIRIYSVVPISHKYGIIEWINGLTSLKEICTNEYTKINKSMREAQNKYRTKRKVGIENFEKLLNDFPPVLYKWFFKFNDPVEWYAARNKFVRTYAVMNTVGWFMGLGDRHLENIMIDSATGDTFHVDLNCIFEKSKLFEIPEKVPFRLTNNIVDAFGPLKNEGAYRKTMEVALQAMVKYKDLIISNLLSFVYDPSLDIKQGKKSMEESAKILIEKLSTKLEIDDVGIEIENLIREAINIKHLANMYIGWASFI